MLGPSLVGPYERRIKVEVKTCHPRYRTHTKSEAKCLTLRRKGMGTQVYYKETTLLTVYKDPKYNYTN